MTLLIRECIYQL